MILEIMTLGALGMVAGLGFLMTPISNVLNVITVPLGYEYSSCPFCPEFGIKKIEYVDCDNCGDEHGRGYSGAAAYRDGTKYVFCSNECLQDWDDEDDGVVIME